MYDLVHHATEWSSLAGDELLFFHVIPVPMQQVVGDGVGGDFVFFDPDPKDDIRHVCNQDLGLTEASNYGFSSLLPST